MKKIKPLLPSLKEKKRYLAFEILSKLKIRDFSAVAGTITCNSLDFMGALEGARAGLMILPDKYNPESQRGLIRVNHRYTDHLKASLALIDNINGQETIVRSIGVSGILKKAEKRYLE